MELASELLRLGIPLTLIDAKVTREFDFVPNFFHSDYKSEKLCQYYRKPIDLMQLIMNVH